MTDGPLDYARERWEADNAPEAAARSRRDRPGASEDVPDVAELEGEE